MRSVARHQNEQSATCDMRPIAGCMLRDSKTNNNNRMSQVAGRMSQVAGRKSHVAGRAKRKQTGQNDILRLRKTSKFMGRICRPIRFKHDGLETSQKSKKASKKVCFESPPINSSPTKQKLILGYEW